MRRVNAILLLTLGAWSTTFGLNAHGAPYTPESVYAVDFERDLTLTGTAAAFTFVPLAPRDTTRPRGSDSVNGLDRWVVGNSSALADHLRDGEVFVFLVAPATANGVRLLFSRAFAEDLVVYSQALAANFALHHLVRDLVSRPRPEVVAGAERGQEGFRSFYSGHTSTAFTALTASAYTLHLRAHAGAWPWIAATVLGASVGLERVLAGKHFVTDVVAGAAVGTAFGIGIPRLHDQRGEPGLQV